MVLRQATGGVRVHLAVPAATHAEAIVASVRAVEEAGLRALRLDTSDWVTLAEVAERLHVSREAVRLWAVGRTGPGDFPPPAVGSGTAYYSWTEVVHWLRRHGRWTAPPDEPLLPAANLAVQLRAMLRQLSPAHRRLVALTALGYSVPTTTEPNRNGHT